MNAGTPTQIVTLWRDAIATGGGVPVACGSCTACCRSGMSVTLTEDEALRLPHIRKEDGKPRLAHVGRDCSQIDQQTGQCAIYETRPIACRQYDCRVIYLSGMRNIGAGEEMNERLNEWRTEVQTEADAGVIAAMWMHARHFHLKMKWNIGLAAAAASMAVSCMSARELKALGRKHAKKVAQVVRILNGGT